MSNLKKKTPTVKTMLMPENISTSKPLIDINSEIIRAICLNKLA